MRETMARIVARAILIGSSMAGGRLFWARAALGTNQLRMHDCSPDGVLSIGGVSEQMYGEGYLAAWHEVLARELGGRMPGLLYEVGRQAGRWESAEAVRHGVWVPRLLAPFIGRRDLLHRARSSFFFHALIHETMRIMMRMIMTEGGWGAVTELSLREDPMRVVLVNTPETRRPGHGGACACHLLAGTIAGYCETMIGPPVTVQETTCRSRGDPACTFEVRAE